MAPKNYPYLDVCVLPQVALHVMSSRGAILFDEKSDDVLWANAEGLALLGAENIQAALEGKSSLNAATKRQIELATDRLDEVDQASGTMRLRQGFKTILLNFSVEKIALSKSASSVLLVTDMVQPHAKNDALAASLITSLKGYGNAVAVLDAKGGEIATSDNFEKLGLSANVIKNLVKEVSTETDQLVKRRVKTELGNLPAGIARLDDASHHHLLIIANSEAEIALPDEPKSKKPATKRKKPESKKAEAKNSSTGVGAFSNRRDGTGRNSMGRWYFKNEAAEKPADEPKPEEKPKTEAKAKTKTAAKTVKKKTPAKEVVAKETPKKTSTKKADSSKDTGTVKSKKSAPKAEKPAQAKSDEKQASGKSDSVEQNKAQSKKSSEQATPNKAASDRVSIVKVSRGKDGKVETTQTIKPAVATKSDKPVPPPSSPNFKYGNGDKPVRFVWEMDADLRFTKVSKEFADTVGPNAAAIGGLTWDVVTERFGLPNGADIKAVLEKSSTWSGKSVLWPIEGTDLNVPIDLAGLPSYDRDRDFAGFNGFGIIRAADTMVDPDSRGMKLVPANAPQDDDISGRVGFLAKGVKDKELSQDEKENFEVIGEKLTSGEIPVANDDVPPDETDDNEIEFERDRPVDTSILARLPIPVLVYRDQELLFANSEFFDLTGYQKLDELADAGGVDKLFGAEKRLDKAEKGRIFNSGGEALSVEPHLQRVPWDDDKAMLLTLRRSTKTVAGDKRGHNSGEGGALPRAANLGSENDAALARMDEAFGDLGAEDLRNILDTATDGIIILSDEGIVQAMNRSAEALFDIESIEVVEQSLTRLLAPESQRVALDYVASVNGPGVASLLNDGREIIGRTSKGGLVPLFMTVGKLQKTNACCAVMRDITQWKKVEEELVTAKGAAELASAQKSEFLAKVSHEVRTPLNAIIGFSDLMIEERFGKIDNDRYRGYLRDIKSSGTHVLDLINDLLDISKIEAGQMDLDFDACDLNTIVSETVALMQPDANKQRVIIRTSLSAIVPKVVADPRSLKQIILNLVSNSVKYTKSGGQVIVSTVYENSGDVALRVRDTGVGMSEKELAKALEPFQQVSEESNYKQKGTGLGLPLTKAMIEANRAEFHIESVPDEGTLVEVHFPIQRVLADR